MSAVRDDRVLIDGAASNVAFRAGQFVERLLLNRGIQLARASDSSIVTVEDVRSCVDDALVEELKKHLDEEQRNSARVA